MEALTKMARDFGRRYSDMSTAARMMLGALALLAVVVVVLVMTFGKGATYQYVFTNLSPEDATEAGGALKAAGIPFRSEAGGAAVSVPTSQVHEARLLLASQGLPRGGGVGFELFDRGDFGASEFTQRVNLRRATEGELARTISRLQAVRSARVHVTLPEKGLYRDDDRRASAAVVLNLQSGRTMNERELAGVRHLVSSAVAGLDPDNVTIVDQRGTVLAGDQGPAAKLASQQREMEGAFEQRIVDLLAPAVGRSAVVARVTVALDATEVETTQDVYDPDSATVRSERKSTELVTSDATNGNGVAGAAANQPMAPTAGAGSAGPNRAQTSREDEVRNFEIGKKVTRSVSRTPRVTRLSAAILVDGVDGKPRPAVELKRLTDLAKSAVGFDAQRGDVIELSSTAFAKVEEPQIKLAVWERPEYISLSKMVGWALAGIFGILIVLRIFRRTSSAMALLRPGTRVGDVDPALIGAAAIPSAIQMGEAWRMVSPDNANALRDRARELGKTESARAAHLLKAWVAGDNDPSRRDKETTNAG